MDFYRVLFLRKGNRNFVNKLVSAQDHLAGKFIKAPVQELDGLGKALDVLVTIVQGDLLGSQHHTEEGAAIAGGGGNEAVAGVAGGAGLDTLGSLIDVVVVAHGREEVVGGVIGAGGGKVGGGDLNDLGVADGHEHLVLHRFLSNQIEIPGGGVVVGILKAVGIGKVGILTANGLGTGIHLLDEGIDGAGHTLRQNVTGLVGGYHKNAVEKVLHGHLFPYLDAGVAAVGGQVVNGCLGGGEDGVHGQFPAVHSLQHQKGGHDLGEACGIEPLMDIPGV